MARASRCRFQFERVRRADLHQRRDPATKCGHGRLPPARLRDLRQYRDRGIADGDLECPRGRSTTSGHLTVAAGTTFYLANVTLQGGSTFSGTGTLYMNGTTTVTGDVTLTVPTVLAATLTGSGAVHLATPMTWDAGTVTLTGGLEVAQRAHADRVHVQRPCADSTPSCATTARSPGPAARSICRGTRRSSTRATASGTSKPMLI